MDGLSEAEGVHRRNLRVGIGGNGDRDVRRVRFQATGGILRDDLHFEDAVEPVEVQRGDLVAEVGVAEVPGERRRTGRAVFELHAFALAELVRAVDVNLGVEFAQFEFEDPHVAVGRGVVRAPGACGRGEVVHTAAPRADRLIDRAILVETRGAAVDMFVGEGAAEIAGVDEVFGVGGEDGEIEVTAVCAALEGAVRGGKAKGGAPGDVGRAASAVGLSAPSTDVDLFAVAHEEGGRAQVDGGGARSNGRLPFDVAEVRQEAGDVLAAPGVGIDVADDRHAAPCLSVGIGTAAGVALDEVHLIVVGQAVVGTELGGDVVRGSIELGHPAFCVPEWSWLNGPVGQGQVGGQGAAAHEDFQVVESAEAVVRRDFDAVGGIASASAEGASAQEFGEVGAEPGDERVMGTGIGRTAWHRQIGRGGRGGNPEAAFRADVDLPAVEVTEVGAKAVGIVQSIDAGPPEEGGGVEGEIFAIEGEEVAVEPVGLGVGPVDGDVDGGARTEVGLDDAGGGGEVRGACGAEQGDLSPGLVVCQAVRNVGAAASDVGAIQQAGAVGTEHGDGGVADPVGEIVHGGLDGAGRGRVARREGHRAADEGASWAVAGRGPEVVAGAAGIGGEGDFGVDDEGSGSVVLTDGEPNVVAFHLVRTSHFVEGTIFIPLEGEGGGQVGGEAVVLVVKGMVKFKGSIRSDVGGHAPIQPTDGVGVCPGFHCEFEGGPSLSGPAPAEPYARPEVFRPEHGGGLDVFGPMGWVVREVEVLKVGGESAPDPVVSVGGVCVDPFGLPENAFPGANVVVFGRVGFRGPLPAGPPGPLQLDAASDGLGTVQHVVRPLALIGYESDLRGQGASAQEQYGRQEAHHRTNKFGNGFVAGSGQNLNGCCPRGSASRWRGRCCRATHGRRIPRPAWTRRTSG